jgi:4-amino-4-deoxy-L-arabinose transferase-like glycosyltransferase
MTNTMVVLVLVVACCGWLGGVKTRQTTRRVGGLGLLALAVALLAGRRVVLDGTARGMAATALVSLALAGRRVDVGLHEFRPGRVYYRLAVGG